ncbi:Endopeptidase, NLPC/P60 domain containing protein [uncultured Caudovirales phage]|jgi:cell wall-associated NlpC family hydrolase|uniref:Endopeptidase, NLPC/P60 domain containing protein n=1 Tax=uncultured Caudovirales phage TaxID=2100421 RepID=A0A6J7WV90_9CAUD|nr:Endopeptidase, NLPC/P60 domain containing protein [uncultured Caudovirales phage]
MKTAIVLITAIMFWGTGTPPALATNDRTDQAASRSGARTMVGLNALTLAKDYVGTRYCKGGISPRCFDCSGLIKYVYSKQGVKLPGFVSGQMKAATIIPKSSAQPGDLVFFVTKSGYPYHVGIYMGNNEILHSPKPGRKVRVETIWSSRVRFGTIS